MQRLIECVPNFSEGKDQKIIQAIFEAAKTPGVKVFELESNPDHNRCLFTIIGEPEKVLTSAFAAIKKATELINMTKHHGEHPRIGATDVVPFVPVSGVTLVECVELSKKLGKKVADELKLPVYLYEASATRLGRVNLADVRKGEYEGLKEEIKTNSEKKPDFGPLVFHPTAGAIVIGARKYLIAFNVNLDTPDVEMAKAVAKRVREKDGGLPAVKALGFFVDGAAQVSMNLCDFTKTNFDEAYCEVERVAKELGVGIKSSEIYGMVPLEALTEAIKTTFRAKSFKSEQILEKKIWE